MKKIALIEFHFDFFIPLVERLKENGLDVVLWTSHKKTLSQLPPKVMRYPSRFAQVGCVPDGTRILGKPRESLIQLLSQKRNMILDQSQRFDIFQHWKIGRA